MKLNTVQNQETALDWTGEKYLPIKEQSISLHEQDKEGSGLSLSLQENDQQIHDLTASLHNANHQIEEKAILINRKIQKISELSADLKAKEAIIAELSHTIGDICTSNSWRLTAPLRWGGKIFRRYILNTKGLILIKKACRVYKIAGWRGVYNATVTLIRRQMRRPAGICPSPTTLFDQLFEQALNDKTHYVPFRFNKKVNTDIKLIAFYLPQFHPIPENDEAWGKGFTEWTNVSKAVPQFIGHYQPHLPGELGFYDLRMIEVQKRQIELARNYGIHGFCYYYYWFSGKKLLSQPLQTVLGNAELDFPFCICWANENWTRRWDGHENEVIIKQVHSKESDIAFIKDIEAALSDNRYIRINGRPLLIIYRASLLKNAAATAKRWREYCIDAGIGDLFLAAARTFETVDTIPHGFDALIEFPPHHLAVGGKEINNKMHIINPNYQGSIFDYEELIQRARALEKPQVTFFRTVFPSWDNEARKPGRGYTITNASPTLYKRWLKDSISYTQQNNDEKLVFINAWNEWAEGAHLEPDRKYGYAWLQATYDALVQPNSANIQRKVILVSHDAYPFGAQYLALALTKSLVSDFNFAVEVVLLGAGELTSEFAKWSKVHNLSGLDNQGVEATTLTRQLVAAGHTIAIVNSTVSGLFLGTLAKAGINCLSLIHELTNVIKAHNLQSAAKTIAEKAHAAVFPATQVAISFNEFAKLNDNQKIIKPQGLIKKNLLKEQKEYARTHLRTILGLSQNAPIILGMGYADYRKGIDLFIEIGLEVLKTHPHANFIWVGPFEESMQKVVHNLLSKEELRDHFILNEFNSNTDAYFAGADIFALTSREDPFPSVVLQSLEVSVPVIGFAGAGGFTTLLEQGCGVLVPANDTVSYANAIRDLLNNAEKRSELGIHGAEIIEKHHSLHHYIFDLLKWSGIAIKRVSAIVPNYNYAKYLKERLSSIIAQSYPIYEIIILDDASTDNSLEVVKSCLLETVIKHRIITNNTNSGSVFTQWQKGLDNSHGDFIWICEADDIADTTFVERAIEAFDDDEVVLSYTQSRQIDKHGKILANNYHNYTNDISLDKWHRDYICDGKEELAQALAIKNTIPNVSGVIFRKKNLQDAINRFSKTLAQLKIAGDWLIYSELLTNGKISYISESLNSHRRHANSVTIASSSKADHLSEIFFMQKRVSMLTNLSSAVKEKANLYVKQVSKLFGVPSENNLEYGIYSKQAIAYAKELNMNGSVHQDDFIFRFIINHPHFKNPEDAIGYYFKDGLKSANKLQTILNNLGQRFQGNISLLEFASGYGCVTRHLPAVMPQVHLTACDIHTAAVQFISEKLGLPSVLSHHEPEQFTLSQKYDVIFSLSFFSHMPRETWGQWIKAHYRHLKPGGALIFTTHGLLSKERLGNPEISTDGFWFKSESEQLDLDNSEYGLTLVTKQFVEKEVYHQIQRPIEIYEQGFWWEHQDLYVVLHNS